MNGMHAIIGLGNPGERYAGTRHNLGFRVVEAIAASLQVKRPSRHRWSLYSIVSRDSGKLILAQPMTYMNRSGRAVVELCQLYSLQPEQLLIIYDDLDLAPGRIRLRLGGGSGGHRGVESIIDLLGSTDFARLRIGIGRPPEGIDPVDYVLQRPAPEERALYEAAVKLAAEAALAVVSEGLAAAMNRYNRPLPT